MIKTTLKIDGMSCTMCEGHINDTIRRAFNVKKVKSSHIKGLSQVWSEEALDEGKLFSAINETGYTLLSVSSEPDEKKGFSFFGLGKK